MNDHLALAKKLIASSKRIVAFTGAGISAESGIPTYRGAGGGIWKTYDPTQYANIEYFRKDPTLFWSFFKDVRYKALVESEPNPAHLALAALEKQNKLSVVITQNIDGLHQAAGNTNVIELHGNTKIIGCLECDATYDFQFAHDRVQSQMPPLCDACGGLLKPKVVFFGEALPQGAMEMAAQAAMTADLLLVVGSTLEVYPAASLPLIAQQNGARLMIVNLGPTAMDTLADVKVDAKAGEALPALVGR